MSKYAFWVIRVSQLSGHPPPRPPQHYARYARVHLCKIYCMRQKIGVWSYQNWQVWKNRKGFVPDSLNVAVMTQPLVLRYGSCKTVSGVAQKGSESKVPREWRMVVSVRVLILPDLSTGDATKGKEVSRYFVPHCLQCRWCVGVLTWNVFWVLSQGFVNCLVLQRLRNYFRHPIYELCVNTNKHLFLRRVRKIAKSFY
jgi:hypothetical protein